MPPTVLPAWYNLGFSQFKVSKLSCFLCWELLKCLQRAGCHLYRCTAPDHSEFRGKRESDRNNVLFDREIGLIQNKFLREVLRTARFLASLRSSAWVLSSCPPQLHSRNDGVLKWLISWREWLNERETAGVEVAKSDMPVVYILHAIHQMSPVHKSSCNLHANRGRILEKQLTRRWPTFHTGKTHPILS
ncbi:uncharacterized protein ASPGLDRAFT_1031838 [Aspergillus glaucus CBS 516.65]|uniref:Uncharacterized protein n=1 Tax=Aspergillus glaucus CBS 516.65 TaxID=1160497 RepID=A0A1L9VW60_ASPGL|nr:hypothetical protein ASPGLDRAFT_1031838 [Aspergillus glaucus CBS 516.65]OJJ88135.1 hypothetical protein ASPGLDRAFT_1031838 [Aspergillus glaucus CBS 516.65]